MYFLLSLQVFKLLNWSGSFGTLCAKPRQAHRRSLFTRWQTRLKGNHQAYEDYPTSVLYIPHYVRMTEYPPKQQMDHLALSVNITTNTEDNNIYYRWMSLSPRLFLTRYFLAYTVHGVSNEIAKRNLYLTQCGYKKFSSLIRYLYNSLRRHIF